MPLLVIRLVIPHERRDGNGVDDALHAIQPSIPLRMILPIINEIAHIDEESRVRVPLPGHLGELPPTCIVARLRIGKDERAKRAAIICLERRPAASLLTRRNAVAVPRTTLQSCDLSRIKIDRHAVLRESLLLCGETLRLRRLSARQFHGGRDKRRGRLPHDGARRRVVLCDDLPQIGDTPPPECCRGPVPEFRQDPPARQHPASAQHDSTGAE